MLVTLFKMCWYLSGSIYYIDYINIYCAKNIIPIKYLFILSIPLLLDVIFVSLGIYNYSKLIALFTGFIFGSAAFYYFYNGIEIFLYEKRINK